MVALDVKAQKLFALGMLIGAFLVLTVYDGSGLTYVKTQFATGQMFRSVDDGNPSMPAPDEEQWELQELEEEVEHGQASEEELEQAEAVEAADEAAAKNHKGGETEEENEDPSSLVDTELDQVKEGGGEEEEEEIPARIDWLHVPKTGTSFLYSLLYYHCDAKIVSKAKGLSGDAALEAEKKQLESHFFGVLHGKNRQSCEHGLRWYHKPIKRAKAGHSFYKLNQVVTVYRQALDRIASGFVHDLHDCIDIQKRGLKPKQVCQILGNPNSPKEKMEAARARIMTYAKCVRGCATRMTTGRVCQHYNIPDTYAEKYLPIALEKIQGFGFVGLTDRWHESMCVFSQKFKRPSGEPYPTDKIDVNMRPSTNKNCEDYVKDVLTEEGFDDPYDQALYDGALKIHEANLEKYPQCKLENIKKRLI